jgi:hypothetical protein
VPDAVDPGLTFAGVGGAQLVRFAWNEKNPENVGESDCDINIPKSNNLSRCFLSLYNW